MINEFLTYCRIELATATGSGPLFAAIMWVAMLPVRLPKAGAESVRPHD